MANQSSPDLITFHIFDAPLSVSIETLMATVVVLYVWVTYLACSVDLVVGAIFSLGCFVLIRCCVLCKNPDMGKLGDQKG